ncbi:hypothetical protein HMPREF0168_1727 [Bifidobacterium dentium ATCC 27679]|uniref:Uncharacterized protein n=1 Tax=Bifidobacterium dentium ATCC 27679 TaxID=871562 RepID=E0Q9S9_9BIFI|nr:hypothetical protein HMPREF0168_1727 [Bifidobacterium dentium ATCC 27679]
MFDFRLGKGVIATCQVDFGVIRLMVGVPAVRRCRMVGCVRHAGVRHEAHAIAQSSGENRTR